MRTNEFPVWILNRNIGRKYIIIRITHGHYFCSFSIMPFTEISTIKYCTYFTFVNDNPALKCAGAKFE